MTLTTSFHSPAALAVLGERPAGRRLVFHALAGRLHLFGDPAELAELMPPLAAAGLLVIECRGLTGTPASTGVAVRALRRRVRTALDPGGIMALGERWQGGPDGMDSRPSD